MPAPDAHLTAVLDCLRTSGKPLSKAEILAATGLDESLWPKLLAQLRDASQIVQQGQKRGTRYSLPAAEGA
jgi:DNA-binding IclR family transcriptional regulator